MGDETSSQGGIRGPCHQNMQMRRGEEMWVLDSGPLTVFPVLRGCVSKSCDHSDASVDKAYIFCLHLRLLLNEEDLRQHGVSPACL